MEVINFIIHFTERWLGQLSNVVLAFLGVLLCVLVISALWDRRVRLMGATAGVFLGLGVIFHRPIIRILREMDSVDRFRSLLTLLSIAVITVIVQAYTKKILLPRQALLWLTFSLVLFIAAVMPGILQPVLNLAGVQYHILIAGFALTFLLLLCLSFSLRISLLQRRVDALTKRMRELQKAFRQERSLLSEESELARIFENGESCSDDTAPLKKSSIFSADTVGRTIRGTKIGAPLVIVFAAIAVLTVGLMTPQPMVGDEVTHYYMLVKQSHDLSKPNFYADIPMASGGIEVRRYPHSFVWHYLGAVIYHFTGGSFLAIQIYQTLFLVQLLLVAYLLARSRGGVESRSALVYVLSIASLPLCLIFSVAFYQDVPMTAQVLTAFYLLSRKRWLFSSLFMAFAIGLKVTAVLFYPAFFILLAYFVVKQEGWKRGFVLFVFSLLIVFGLTWSLGKAINIYAEAVFYPQEKLEQVLSQVQSRLSSLYSTDQTGKSTNMQAVTQTSSAIKYASIKTNETEPVIIANHPGDLRIKENYLIYGGIILWILICAGCFAYLPWLRKKGLASKIRSTWWLWLVGGSYILLTAIFTKTAPDARFFLPGLPFVLLPIAERIVRLPKPKILITLLTALAILQGGYVLSKTHKLRVVSSGIQAAIEYLAENPPIPARIFMYPEGNYRLFNVQHEWYLGYRLREFWRADNDKRITMLNTFGIGAIVIKKQLISAVNDEITNLGVYPDYFVKELSEDPRFYKLFEDVDIVIYRVPGFG